MIVGEHNYKPYYEDSLDEGGQKIKVAEWIVHHFNRKTTDNDIAILRLKEKIQVGNNVGLIEWRDSPSATYEGMDATVIGWGATENNEVKYHNITYIQRLYKE